MTRRGWFVGVASLLGIVPKAVAAVPERARLVITLADEPDEQFLQRFYAKWNERFAGGMPLPIVVGPGCTVKPLDAVSEISERLGDYEWKVVGRTGAEAVEMLKHVAFDPQFAGCPIVGAVDGAQDAV